MNFAIKPLLIFLILINNVCYAQIILRFQPHIDNNATLLGDVLEITNDQHHWSVLPLQSHPTAGSSITKEYIVGWMKQRLGDFSDECASPVGTNIGKELRPGIPSSALRAPSPHVWGEGSKEEVLCWEWQGKTQIHVKPLRQSSGALLLEKAKTALKSQLGSHYTRVEITPLSNLIDSEYALDQFKTEMTIAYPTAKRVCVWLTHGKKRIAVWFKVSAYARVLVANRDLHYHTLIHSDAFSWHERDIAGLNDQPAQSLPENFWLKSSIERDKILLANQLKEPPLVIQGQHINVSVHNHSITVVIDGVALGDGYLGQTVTVKNPLNQKTFVAIVSGLQQAEITS